MENLLFFNKEGYPLNLQYDDVGDKWEGKVIFDENASDTFKTTTLYVFESVDPISFTDTIDFKKISYYNDSGITYAGEGKYNNIKIDNIEAVNESDYYYSKWIYGDNFNNIFPLGTVVKFLNMSGSTGYDDFDDDKYYTVLETKSGAFLINTTTVNDSFNYTFYSGNTSTLNVISISDYNRNLESEDFLQGIYPEKKLNIVDSRLNDGLYGMERSGITYTKIKSLELSGNIGERYDVNLTKLTERPRIYKGSARLDKISGYYYIILTKINSNFSVGGDIIFETERGRNLFFGWSYLIDEIINRIDIGERDVNFFSTIVRKDTNPDTGYLTDYLITFKQYADISVNDVILFSGSTGKNSNRELRVLNVKYTDDGDMVLRTAGYVIPEELETYHLYKILRPDQITKMRVTPSGYVPSTYNFHYGQSVCYPTNSTLTLSQEILSGITGNTYYQTALSFIRKHKGTLYTHGVEVYYTENGGYEYLTFEGKYGTNTYNNSTGIENTYFDVFGDIDGNLVNEDFRYSDSSGITQRYDLIIEETLVNESNYLYQTDILTKNYSSEILFNINYNTSGYGFKLTINKDEFFVKFDTDTQGTINKFINTHGDIIYRNGYIISSGYTSNYTLKIDGIYSDSNVWDLEVIVNMLSTYEILYENNSIGAVISGSEIQSPNLNFFNIGLSTGMLISLSGSTYAENNTKYNIIGLSEHIIQLSYQGTFFNDNSVFITAITDEYIRRPRYSYFKDIYFKVSWIPPIDDSFFFYDMSGDQLIPYNNDKLLTYTGVKPLTTDDDENKLYLNDSPNRLSEKINDPYSQQTVFKELHIKLDQLDSSERFIYNPTPLEIHIGYNSKEEGVNYNNLKIEVIEMFENTKQAFGYSGYTTPGYLSINNFTITDDIIYYDNPGFNFLDFGFEIGQLLSVDFIDQALSNQIIFNGTGVYLIKDLSRDTITIDETLSGFTTTGSTFWFNLEVKPKEISNIMLYGETEIEESRFEVNLNNVGIQIDEDVSHIFADSDINDYTADYKLLNKKRKEMLTNYREIYDYIGSYKALINAINYFGYADLELYEYYQNIDHNSPLFKKLHKIWIPDIFNNEVEGWSEIDFIGGKYQNNDVWKKTNLFNLTYRITDEEGNNVQMYTLEEVQFKLQKMKNWLRQNILPISSNLLDITGISDTKQTLYQEYDESNQTKKAVVERDSTVVNFNYSTTLNFGTNYLVNVNFYILTGKTGNEPYTAVEPDFYTVKIKTYFLSGTTMIPVQYHKLRKNDLLPFNFNIDKDYDPYIYIETTAYDNNGAGVGYTNNKMFYFDEPRNHWLVNHNFDMTKYKFILREEYLTPNTLDTTRNANKNYKPKPNYVTKSVPFADSVKKLLK